MDLFNNYRMTIDGKQVGSQSEIPVINPANGKEFAHAPNCSDVLLDEAVASSRAAFKAWAGLSIADRQTYLREIGGSLEKYADDFALLFTREQGRPLAAAKAEIFRAGSWFKEVATLEPPVHVIADTPISKIETRFVPVGVVCAISPWNFPVLLSCWKIAPALLAGNTMVLKPSPFTPLCVLKLGELLSSILPPGVLNVISGDDSLGPKMTEHKGFDKISFTGSTATGKKVLENAAKDLKRVTLELGGNDAAIVLNDVDVDDVAAKIFYGAFYNSAQICVATKRLYVHEDIYDVLLERLVDLSQKFNVGNGEDPKSDFGPIQNIRQYQRVMNLISEAKEQGLAVIEGREVPDNGGYFIPLTLVDNPPDDCRKPLGLFFLS